jgi:anti-sigma B factor antagonist
MSIAPDSAGQFVVATERTEGMAIVSLSGELDIATADDLTDALDAIELGESERLVIDLSGVGFMDSSGLRILIAAQREATADGYRLTVVTGDSPAKRVLELTRMDAHIEVVPKLS